ncbi:MAG: hypothetical protein WB611_07085 [Stellaceae bacterium]
MRYHRRSVSTIAIASVLLAGITASAQQSGGGLSAEQRDIGRVETRIQKYNQALGVVTRLNRPLGAETECSGICYFPSSSRPVAWRCAPNETCDLHCDVNPPVGGCH